MGGHSHQHSHSPLQGQQSGPAAASGPGLSRQDSVGNAHLAGQLDHGHSHDHGVEPEPGAAATVDLEAERPVGSPVPAEIRDPLVVQLRASARVDWLLDEIDGERGDLDFSMTWSDRGTFHRSGAIFLRRDSAPETWFASLAHELVHLLTHESGQAADATTMDRDTFVSTKMADEINAQALSYVATLQTGRDRGGAYFDRFSDFLAQNHPDLLVCDGDEQLDAQIWAEVEEIGRVWLEDQYRNHLVTNNTKENYYTYWGNYWDKINPGG